MSEAHAVAKGVVRWLQREENKTMLEEGMSYFTRITDEEYEIFVPKMRKFCIKLWVEMGATFWLGGFRPVGFDYKFVGPRGYLWDWIDCVYEAFGFLLDGSWHE